MIEKIRSDYQFNTEDFRVECDNPDCSNDTEFEIDGGWSQLLIEMKKEGWLSIKDEDGDWLNFCSKECRDKYFSGGSKG